MLKAGVKISKNAVDLIVSMHPGRVAMLLAICALSISAPAYCTLVGDIQAVYYAPNTFGVPSDLDAPAFIFQNTSGTDITNAVFSILSGTGVTPDSFSIGTIAANSNFVLELGITTDGGSGHTFFAPVSGGTDTSDSGPSADNVTFEFTGLQGGLSVDSGTFTPAATRTTSNDGTESINFLGSEDGACYNCFGPAVIADLNTGTSPVPEPASTALLSTGLLAAIGVLRRRRNGVR